MDEIPPKTEEPKPEESPDNNKPKRENMAPQAKPESRYTPEQNCLGCVITLVVVLVAFGIAIAYYIAKNPEFHGK
jgi:hypothetical protein